MTAEAIKTSEARIIIVGGGAVGLTLAWELLRRGQQVTLLDRERIGCGTSWAATGILPPARWETATDPLDQLRGYSHALFPRWAEELGRVSGVDVGFRQCGGWYLAESRGERAAMIGMADYWQALGIECDRQPLEELCRREPGLADWARAHIRAQDQGLSETPPTLSLSSAKSAERRQKEPLGGQTTQFRKSSEPAAAAWWVPGECQIRSPDFLRALTIALRDGGAELVEGASVDDLRDRDQGAEVFVGGSWRGADAVIVCGGAWSGRVAHRFGLEQSLVPVRGQILLLRSARPLLRSVVNVGHRYLVCRDDGRTLVGSVEEEVGFRFGTTPEVLQRLYEFACGVCPGLRDAVVERSWSGLRPMTFDGFPMIGRIPETGHLYVAAGHFRSGIHWSCGTAVALADQILGHRPELDLSRFRVGKQQQGEWRGE